MGEVKIGEDGVTYDGTDEAGKPEGMGKATFDNGEVYEGIFIEGKRHGKGEFKFGDTHSYTGDFKEDKFSGFGKYFTQMNKVNCFYAGELSGNTKHGAGKETCIGTDKFENTEQLENAHDKYEWNNYWYFDGQYDSGKYTGPFKHQTSEAKIQGRLEHNQLTQSQVRTMDGTSLISNYTNNKAEGVYAWKRPNG